VPEEEEIYDLKFLKYKAEDYQELNEKLLSGEVSINVSATVTVLKLIFNVLISIHSSLTEILAAGRHIPFRVVRRFAVETVMLDSMEIILYNACKTPKDDIFYLPEDHPDIVRLRKNTYEHTIETYPKYKWELTFTLNSVTAGGAAVFKALEQEGIINQGAHLATHGAYYRLLKDEGSAQFRYWISQNKHDYKKMLTFFNLQNLKFIKTGSKIVYDRIAINQVFFVPMIAKVFDMHESSKYDNMSDKDVTRFS
jgi:hypothetical protein